MSISILKPFLFDFALSKVKEKLSSKGFTLNFEEGEISGFSSVSFTQLQVVDAQKPEDTLLNADRIVVSVSPFWGILGQGWVNRIEIGTLEALYDQRFDRLTGDESKDSIKTNVQTNNKINVVHLVQSLKRALKELPTSFTANRLALTVNRDSTEKNYSLNAVKWEDEILNLTVQIKTKETLQQIQISGSLDPSTLEGDLKLGSANGTVVFIPWKDGQLGFREIACRLNKVTTESNALNVDLNGRFEDVYIQHPRISDTLVHFKHIEGTPRLLIADTFVQIDSNSHWKLNRFNFLAGARTSLQTKFKTHWGLIKISQEEGKNLFESLPEGLFKLTHGIKLKGSFGHRFYVWVDEQHLDKTIMEASVNYTKDFKVIAWGNANPSLINGSFFHDYYDGDRWVTRFEVGPGNPFYTQYSQISPLLVESTLRSEDPSFFGHQGFYLEAFREALMANLREKRFARGGSTISMQLIKNVYLRQHKTLTRKLEELLLVWLIEHERSVSKTRMLEVYFNIIEWGPGIFGVGEASRFYFGKSPSQLNMGESCYLSSLIPAPSKSRWSVDSTGNVSPRWSRYFKLKNRIQSLDSTRFQASDFDFKIRAFNN